MRIVVATLYATIGGSSKILLAAAEALRRDHAVTVRAPLAEADSVIPLPMSSRSLETWRQKIAVLPELASLFFKELRWIRRQRPDVVYVHDDLALYVYGLIGRLCGLTVVWHVHMREGRGLSRRLRDTLCDAKIFVSRFIVGADQSRPWALIRNPIDVAARLPSKPGPVLRIGVIGSISRLKNQDMAVRAVDALRRAGTSCRLDLFGTSIDDEYAAQVRASIGQMGLGDVISFRGFVPVEQALADVDVLLSCSIYESFGLAVVEGLACGVPVVASDIEAHREIAAILGTDALTLSPLDAKAMAGAIAAARPDDRAPQRVLAEFGKDRFTAEIAKFFGGIANRTVSIGPSEV